MLFKIKNDMTLAMREALKAAWEFEQRHHDRPFIAASVCAIEPTLKALAKRGFIESATGISYRLTKRGLNYASFHWPEPVSKIKFG